MQQGSMNLLDFQNKFSTEEACQEHLFNMRWPNGYRCPRCDHNKAYFHQSRHLHQCKKCGYQASLTAGTIFHKTRTPLVKWFWTLPTIHHLSFFLFLIFTTYTVPSKKRKFLWEKIDEIYHGKED